MTEQRRNLATGFVRCAGLLLLLGGVLVMHILVAAPGHMQRVEQAAAQAITPMAAAGSAAGDHAASPMAARHGSAMPGGRVMSVTSPAMLDAHSGNGCDCGGCGMRGGMHACVFILAALTLLLGLALLGRIGSGAHDSARPAPRWLSRRARPPPWTMPSLAELSVLRV